MKYLPLLSLCASLFFSRPVLAAWDQPAIEEFVKRIMKDRSPQFIVEYIPADQGKDVFELESRNGRIILRGNNGTSVGSALNHYLKEYCHCLITWNGVNMNLPPALPVVSEKVRRTTPYRYRYYLNYCTFNYSMAWWDWDRWQKEIDWMTLNGINMPLALTGEESIWNKVYKSMGFDQAQLDSFFSGPSYFAWFWMGNLDAWGGPLSQHWMDMQEDLQKKILKAERSMGMTPVLPAFTGHVPPSFASKFPKANIKKTNWRSGFEDVLLLDPSDPLFEEIGKRFMLEQTRVYGTDHLYSADTFNENIPPTNDSAYLSSISRKVFTSMAATDPKAVWVMQGWMFHFNRSFWHPAQMQALLNAVPDQQMIILDLYSESFPLWRKTKAYYGKPWIWNMLHNFGGNISLWGRINSPAEDPAAALADPDSGNMTGIGLTPEAIEQNPVLYHLMLENVWRKEPIELDSWLKKYARQRYGAENPAINEAWNILAHSVYQGSLAEGGPESILTGRPTLDLSTKWTDTKLDYDPLQLALAWDKFIEEAGTLGSSDGFQYDLVDITRQVLANYAGVVHEKAAIAYRKKDPASFKKYAAEFLTLLDDLDKLLLTREDFLLGKWINAARAKGITREEKNQYEKNARNLITLWGDKNSPLHEYSCRQWNGLIKGFYRPRWQYFFDKVTLDLQAGVEPDWKGMQEELKNWEWQWVNGHEAYTTTASGDPVETSRALYRKYRSVLGKAGITKE